MIITGSIIGGISFGIQAYNSWRNEKNAIRIREAQEAFQHAALAQNLDEAKALYEKMISTKRVLMQEERDNQMRIMQEQHVESLHTIEYLASLDKWPLAVMPLVMRDDNLFSLTNNKDIIVPINIIFGPCRDRNFHTQIWKLVEEEVAIRMASFWSITGSHPIIFYQDAWKDDRDQAESAICANIHAKIPQTPTIILSPIITRNGLQIELTHWCVDGIDPNKSYKKEIRLSLEGCCHLFKKGDEYDTPLAAGYVQELSDLIESVVGFLDDQYMWLRYNTLPQLPAILQERIKTADNSRDLIYKQYVDILQSSLANGHIHIIEHLQLVLAYCAIVDHFGKTHDAFDVVRRAYYGKNLLGDIVKDTPTYEPTKMMLFLSFCKENKEMIELSAASYHQMRCGISLACLKKECQEKLAECDALVSSAEAKKNMFFDSLIQDILNDFLKQCDTASHDVIQQCKLKTNSGVDKRNWCRPLYMEKLNGFFNNAVEELLSKVDEHSIQYIDEMAQICTDATWEKLKNDSTLGIHPEDGDSMSKEDTNIILSTARQAIKEYAKSKAIAGNHNFWQQNYLHESADKKLVDYCNAVLRGWIKYRFGKEDIINEKLDDSSQQSIRVAMEAVQAMITAIASNYVDILYPKHDGDYSPFRPNEQQ